MTELNLRQYEAVYEIPAKLVVRVNTSAPNQVDAIVSSRDVVYQLNRSSISTLEINELDLEYAELITINANQAQSCNSFEIEAVQSDGVVQLVKGLKSKKDAFLKVADLLLQKSQYSCIEIFELHSHIRTKIKEVDEHGRFVQK